MPNGSEVLNKHDFCAPARTTGTGSRWRCHFQFWLHLSIKPTQEHVLKMAAPNVSYVSKVMF